MNEGTPASGGTAFIRDLRCIRRAAVLGLKTTYEWLIRPASWPATFRWLLDWVWRILRPTLIRALCANRQIPDSSAAQSGEGTDQEELRDCTPEELALAVNTLLSVYESDQRRVRSIESKAFRALQVAGLVFAGSAITLRITLTEGAPDSPTAFWLVVVSGLYLFASLVAELNVTKLRQTRVWRVVWCFPWSGGIREKGVSTTFVGLGPL